MNPKSFVGLPTEPGLYYVRKTYLNNEDIWIHCEVLRDNKGELRVWRGGPFADHGYDFDMASDYGLEFEWHGPLPPPPWPRQIMWKRRNRFSGDEEE
jgi:hypothetical protein